MTNLPSVLADFSQQLQDIEAGQRRRIEAVAADQERLYATRHERVRVALNTLAGAISNLEDALTLARETMEDLTKVFNTSTPKEVQAVDDLRRIASDFSMSER